MVLYFWNLSFWLRVSKLWADSFCGRSVEVCAPAASLTPNQWLRQQSRKQYCNHQGCPLRLQEVRCQRQDLYLVVSLLKSRHHCCIVRKKGGGEIIGLWASLMSRYTASLPATLSPIGTYYHEAFLSGKIVIKLLAKEGLTALLE